VVSSAPFAVGQSLICVLMVRIDRFVKYMEEAISQGSFIIDMHEKKIVSKDFISSQSTQFKTTRWSSAKAKSNIVESACLKEY
jgi:hypothetical protein